MRHIMQGFTMFRESEDFGFDTEEVDLPIPTPVTQSYRGGGQDLGVDLPMAAIEALEATIKMAGHNPTIMGMMGKAPGITERLTFRAAVLNEVGGGYDTHLCIIEGSPNAGSRDRWQRGEKSGLEFRMTGIVYFRYEVGSTVIHELQAWPPRRIVNGSDQLSDINQALGYA